MAFNHWLNRWCRALREGGKSMVRNGWMSIAAVNAVAVTMFILGAFYLLTVNVNHLTREVENQVEMKVYLELAATQSEVDEVEDFLRNHSVVKSVTFVPKEEGLDQLSESLGEWGEMIEGLKVENPLPDAFEVAVYDPQEIPGLAQEVEAFSSVDYADYGEEVLSQLLGFTETIRYVGLALVLLLALTAVFLISNTIRITIYSRRQEIEIMKLVGATNGTVRGPFLIEGLLLGLTGALISAVLLGGGYALFVDKLHEDLAFYGIELLSAMPLLSQLVLFQLFAGAFIGSGGSWVSVRRFLKV